MHVVVLEAQDDVVGKVETTKTLSVEWPQRWAANKRAGGDRVRSDVAVADLQQNPPGSFLESSFSFSWIFEDPLAGFGCLFWRRRERGLRGNRR